MATCHYDRRFCYAIRQYLTEQSRSPDGMQGVDPVHMGVVGLMGSGSAGVIGATQGDHPLTMSGDTAAVLDAAPKYVNSDPFNLSPERANDWQVQYSRDYAKSAASNPFGIPLVDHTSFFRPEQLFDK